MNGSEKGFTLLEVIITLVIITLVLAVSYPSLSNATASLSLRTTGRDILSTFRYAREKAVTEQTAIRVTVDREHQVLQLSDDFGENKRQYALPETVRIQRVTLGGNEVEDSSATIRFLPNGSSDTVEVFLQSRNGAYLKIISDPINGGTCIRINSEEATS
jgi:type II secretion system protein H